MFSVALLGHSLVPEPIVVDDLPDVIVDVYQYPGSTIDVLTRNLTRDQFWSKTYDSVILCIGGNDITREEPQIVFCELCNLVNRVAYRTKYLNACTIEHRHYQWGNRFFTDTGEYQRKVLQTYKRIKCFTHHLGYRHLDMGKTVFTWNRNQDRVHFNRHRSNKFLTNIVREIKAVYHKETSA